MKGYRMVLLVNGGILLFIALNGWFLGNLLDAQAQRCQEEQGENCAQTRDTATTAYNVSPVLAVVGILLLILGGTLGRPNKFPVKPAEEPSAWAQTVQDWTKALRDSPEGLLIDVEVVPNSSSPGFPVGFNPWRNRIQARVSAPAEEGMANEELVILVAAALNVPRTDLTLMEGHTSRRKRLRVRGVTVNDFMRRLAEASGEA